jgi:thioredoxin-related protein
MKQLIFCLAIVLSLNGFTQQQKIEWHTDVNNAVNISVQTGKPLFFFFTGSDWCGWCKKLVKEVFVKEEFKSWATKNVILVELDFPRRTPISNDLKKQNKELGQMFGVRGYPTVWLVTPTISDGKVNFNKLGSQGYVAGGPKSWISAANKILNISDWVYKEEFKNDFKIASTTPKDTKIPKYPPELSISDIKFNDPNNNNTIEANENVSLEFDLKNTGEGEAQNIKIQIEELNSISGLDYQKTIQLSSLASSRNKKIKIPVTGLMNISTGKANFKIKILEGNGFNADPLNFDIATKSFIHPNLEIVDFKFFSDYGKIEVGKIASVQFAIQNTGQGVAEDVNIKINIPKNVFASDEQEHRISSLNPGDIKQYDFEFFANKNYTNSSITIDAIITERFNEYGTSVSMKEQIGKSIRKAIIFNPESTVKQNTVDIKPFSLTSIVDKNIPINSKVNNRFALVIGNEDYASYQFGLQNEQNVDYAVNDAMVFEQYALKTLGVKLENMFSITNATSGVMSQEIKKVIKLTELEGKDAELIIYYAGHGFPDDQKAPHLIPVDVSGGDLSRAINLQELYKDLGDLKAKKVTVFLDACFTGGGRESGLMASRGVKVKPKEGSLGGSLVVFSASSGEQSSLPFNKEKHGVFTYHLLKALQDAEGDISYGNLYDAINIEVNKTTLRNQGMEQTPKVNTSQKVINDWRNWKF